MRTEVLLALCILGLIPALVFLMFFIVSAWIRKLKSEKYISNLKTELAASEEDLLKMFYTRTNSYKFQAYIILLLVIGSLFIGGLIFYAAGQIAGRDLYYSDVNYYGDTYESKLVNRFMSVYCEENNVPKPDEEIDFLKWRDLRDKVKTIYRKEISADFEEHQNQLKNEKIDTQVFALISTSLIRIGIVTLLIFLVQIFLRLYRYNLKLSDYYKARFDAVLLSKTEKLDFEKSITLMYPNFDVGKEIKNPMGEMINLLKNVKEIIK
jgi:uncharacterized protein YlbG (UPF0298 family)